MAKRDTVLRPGVAPRRRELGVWATVADVLGFHHVPREEDWPVMPVMWHDLIIRAFHFSAQNPALDLPKEP